MNKNNSLLLYLWVFGFSTSLFLSGLRDQIQFKNDTNEYSHPIPVNLRRIIAYWKKYIDHERTVDKIVGSLMFTKDNPCTMEFWLNRTSTDAGMVQEVAGPYTETEIAKALIDQAIIHARISGCAQLRINVHESQLHRLSMDKGGVQVNLKRPRWYEWTYELPQE